MQCLFPPRCIAAYLFVLVSVCHISGLRQVSGDSWLLILWAALVHGQHEVGGSSVPAGGRAGDELGYGVVELGHSIGALWVDPSVFFLGLISLQRILMQPSAWRVKNCLPSR